MMRFIERARASSGVITYKWGWAILFLIGIVLFYLAGSEITISDRYRIILLDAGRLVLVSSTVTATLRAMQVSGLFKDSVQEAILFSDGISHFVNRKNAWTTFTENVFKDRFGTGNVDHGLNLDFVNVFGNCNYYVDSIERSIVIDVVDVEKKIIHVVEDVRMKISVSNNDNPVFTFKHTRYHEDHEILINEHIIQEIGTTNRLEENIGDDLEKNIIFRSFDLKNGKKYELFRKMSKKQSLDKDPILGYKAMVPHKSSKIVVEARNPRLRFVFRQYGLADGHIAAIGSSVDGLLTKMEAVSAVTLLPGSGYAVTVIWV
jgi:hypothetical protein